MYLYRRKFEYDGYWILFLFFFKAYVGVLSSGEALLYPQVALSSAGYAVLYLHDNGQISYNVSTYIYI